jgi:hypothetical protein
MLWSFFAIATSCKHIRKPGAAARRKMLRFSVVLERNGGSRMQKFAAAAFVSLLAATTASAQMKPAPTTTTQQQGPVRVEMNQKGLQPVPEAPLESAKRIGRDEAIKLVKAKKAVYVDVRSKESYEAEHIKGAINVPLSDIITRVKELPRGKQIITYCA